MNSNPAAHEIGQTNVLLRTAAILWVVWGVVHVLAGVMTISQETAAAISGIADAVDPETLKLDYPAAAGAIVNQHGFNLAWIGTVTTIGAIFVWQRKRWAIWLTALIAGLIDIGYFLFMDLGGYVNFIPGTVMTLICAVAIVLSFLAEFDLRNHSMVQPNDEASP